jgi:glycosyltransferase involved in cell wall biosynthesis
LGRLSEEKGHSSLLEALKVLRCRNVLPIAMFAGVGPLEAELRARCEVGGLNGQVRFLGYRADLKTVLAASDLVVLPSISEGLPLAAIEALAAGRPIVATNIGGIPEVVVDERTGLLVPPQQPALLAQAIHRILTDPNLAGRLGREGRLFAERHFDVRVQIERTMNFYSEIAKSKAMKLRSGGQFESGRQPMASPSSISQKPSPVMPTGDQQL